MEILLFGMMKMLAGFVCLCIPNTTQICKEQLKNSTNSKAGWDCVTILQSSHSIFTSFKTNSELFSFVLPQLHVCRLPVDKFTVLLSV